MPYAIAPDGTRLFYEHAVPPAPQSAPTALLLAPLGLSSRLYGFAAEFATASGYAALTFDNRGCGLSDAPSRPWSMRTMASDAITVLDAVGVERAHVCGPSLGGFVAQELAIEFPERVGALVLAATTGGLPRVDLLPWRNALAALKRRMAPRRTALTEDDAIRRFLEVMVSRTFARATQPGSPTWRIAAQLVEAPPSRRGLVGQLLAGATYVGWPRLQRIKAPTQVQHGTLDRVVPFHAGARLARCLPDASLVCFDGAGHALILERPDEVAHATYAFLRRHDDLLQART
jgi:3-oxoadipate enol-lactonase